MFWLGRNTYFFLSYILGFGMNFGDFCLEKGDEWIVDWWINESATFCYRYLLAWLMINDNFSDVLSRRWTSCSTWFDSSSNLISFCLILLIRWHIRWEFHWCCWYWKFVTLCSSLKMLCGLWNIIRNLNGICLLIGINRTRRLQIQFGCNFRAQRSQKMCCKHSDRKLFTSSDDDSANKFKWRRHKLHWNDCIFCSMQNNSRYHFNLRNNWVVPFFPYV